MTRRTAVTRTIIWGRRMPCSSGCSTRRVTRRGSDSPMGRKTDGRDKQGEIPRTGITQFAKLGYDRANINTIAKKKAGISVGVLYKFTGARKNSFFVLRQEEPGSPCRRFWTRSAAPGSTRRSQAGASGAGRGGFLSPGTTGRRCAAFITWITNWEKGGGDPAAGPGNRGGVFPGCMSG